MEDGDRLDRDAELIERRVTDHLERFAEHYIDRLMEQATEERRREIRRFNDRVIELDKILRGEKGSNGVASDVRMLKAAEEARVWRERLIIAGIVGTLIASLASLILK